MTRPRRRSAQSLFSSAVNLRGLVSLIGEAEWTSLGVDVKAAAYEGLLEKAAAEGKKGAGQYFTPRILIQSVVRCMRPDPLAGPEVTICDPAGRGTARRRGRGRSGCRRRRRRGGRFASG
jgi:type I restriction-modification system DNA methylase subunit